ncbi:sugar phosphate isomerase/epimerase family protein [Halosimplex aquaticum]|uniref:Sugar phosphate isomerase/epimerase family protein n=1 Tax=Halosimplex aquaticum TaxID=3026162 RepID=A0ABD5XTS7_9EURY|nr:sugar phosphate isomerase/epimerase [Halosimplex aquaticum]
MRIGIQPYTISAIDEPLPAKLGRIARAGYEGVELGPDANTDAVHEALDASDLAVSSVGSGLDALDDDLDAHVAACEGFDTDNVVVMWIDPEHFETREAVESTAERLDAAADRLADRGLRLHYHNHDHEFTDLGETTGYEALVDATDAVRFEVDAGWAGVGGVDPAALLGDIGDRVSLVHLKDMDFDSGEFVMFGEGDLDVAETVAAARRIDAEWGLFENDEPVDPVAEPSHASILLDEHTGHLGRRETRTDGD